METTPCNTKQRTWTPKFFCVHTDHTVSKSLHSTYHHLVFVTISLPFEYECHVHSIPGAWHKVDTQYIYFSIIALEN